MRTLRHVTYNLLDYGDDAPRDRLARVRETISSTHAGVVSVQEIKGRDTAERVAVFGQFAADLGFEYLAIDAATGTLRPVFDAGHGTRGVGVMWRPNLIPVPGSLRTYDKAGLSVGMALVRLRIGSVEITVASTHWRPRLPRGRADEGVFVSREIAKHGTHGIVGADWNNIFASPGEHGQYYDEDPYAKQPWNPSWIGKARPDHETNTGIARREAMQELQDGGLVDPAAYIRTGWYRTVGHWKTDELDKRIDGPMVTKTVADATLSITSLDTHLAHSASNHLPVILDIDPDALAAGGAGIS